MRHIAMMLAALALAVAPAAAQQGVTDDEIVLGSHADLSGPFAAFSAPAMKAAQLHFDEVNAKGGVHGRKIRLVVEDAGYQVPRAVQAANKLINRDRIFAMFMALGTSQNLAAFKLQEAKGVPNFFPMSLARVMLDEPIDLKFVLYSTYYDGIYAGIEHLKGEGATTVCPMIIPSDAGKEMQLAAMEASRALGMRYAAESTHKPDETEFVGALTRLRGEGCDLVPIFLSVRGVITAVATAKKLGWDDVRFLGSAASFHTAVAKVPGGVTEGLYVGAGWQDFEQRMDDPVLAAWVKGYLEATGEKLPGSGALLGRVGAEAMVRALEAAGPDLTLESFIAAVEGLDYGDRIGGTNIDVGADHLGSSEVFISKIENGSWRLVKRQDAGGN